MQAQLKDASDRRETLEVRLEERLRTVLQQLHSAAWFQQGTACLGDGVDAPLIPRSWKNPQRSEAEQIRLETYTWSRTELGDEYRRPIGISDALNRIEDNATELIRTTVDTIKACVDGLVAPQYRSAVLDRQRLVQEWPWALENIHGALLHLLLALCPTQREEEVLCATWPLYTLSATVADWGQAWLGKNAPAIKDDLVAQMKQTARNTPMVFSVRAGLPFRKLTTPALALLYNLEAEVIQNQKRKFIAIDTCKEHTKLLEACRDLPKSKKPAQWALQKGSRLELILPEKEQKRHIQLSLELGAAGLSEQMIALIREWRGWGGLRHWVTFQSLITANKRLGWVRWTVEEHLKAQNLSPERRRRPEVRRAAAEMVRLFTEIEIAVYDGKGKIREKRPLVLIGSTFERLVDSQWKFEGLELKINPILYRGVRDPESGKLGKNWWPTPEELPHINHNKLGPAIALGTILASRWRMELGQSGKPYIDLKGDSLLKAAGLPYRQRNVSDTWQSMERNLVELQRRGGIEKWEWTGEPSLSSVCRLHAPTWAWERIAHGVPPKEDEPAPTALTGAELKAWRTQAGLTQAQAAERLEVTTRTIQRAEGTPDKPLTKKLRSALANET